MPSDSIDLFYSEAHDVARDRLPAVVDPLANENFILRNGSKSVLATYRPATQTFVRVDKVSAYGITPRNAEQSFALNALLQRRDQAGHAHRQGRHRARRCLALAAALECRSTYRQILLARPIVPLSNRDLGYLPGDIAAKLDPYMQPLYDNLDVIRHQLGDKDANAQRIGEMLESEKLVITPLAYIRGRSLQRMFFIVDEAQNLTPHEVKTIITRAGEGTQDRLHRRHPADRPPVSRFAFQRPELSHQPHEGPADLRPHHAGKRRTLRAGGSGERSAVSFYSAARGKSDGPSMFNFAI